MRQIFLFAFFVGAISASFARPNNRIEISSDFKSLQNEVNTTTSDLEKYKDDILTQMDGIFEEQGEDLMEQFEDTKKDFSNELETEYEKLKKGGKNANSCYKTATDQWNAIYENVTENTGLCQLEAYILDFEPVRTSVDFTLKMGNELIARFDSVIKDCEFWSENTRKNRCFSSNMPSAKILSNSFKEAARDMKELMLESSTHVVLRTVGCALKSFSILEKESMKIKEEFVNCASNE